MFVMVDKRKSEFLHQKWQSYYNFLIYFQNPYHHAMTQLSGHLHTKDGFTEIIIQGVMNLFPTPYFLKRPDFWKIRFLYFLLKILLPSDLYGQGKYLAG